MKSFFSQPIHLGNLTLKNRVFLAPLAGVSDIPFRRICQELGAGLSYVEMLSANAINYGSKRTFSMMQRHASEQVLGVQVTGPNPEATAKAVERLAQQGFDTIDLNMGCPVKKIIKNHCGSAILQHPGKLSHMVSAVRQATELPLSVKVRLGFTREQVNVAENIRRAVTEKVQMFTIHGRTRCENYSHPIDYQGIACGVLSGREQAGDSSVITVGNGDVFDWPSAEKMRCETGCDAVMISRGALGNPWIFQEIVTGEAQLVTIEEWLEVVTRHIRYHREHYGNTPLGVGLIKKQLVWYAKGFPNYKKLREKLKHIQSLDEGENLFLEYVATLPPGLVRGQEWETKASLFEKGYDPKYEMDRSLDRGVGDDCMSG